MAQAAGKLAVVTGASSGIGYELAKQFIEHDYDLIIAAEDNGLQSAAQTLTRPGRSVEAVQADLTTFEGVDMLYAAITRDGRPVDAVALNAGVGVHGPFIETDLKEELKSIALNVISTVHLAKHMARDMSALGKGRILFTASQVSVSPAPFMAVYSATKAFVLSFSDALREELKDTGVTVTSLMPGPTDTNFFERAHMLDTKAGAGKKDDPELLARQGFEGMMKGKAHVVGGGLKSKAMTYMSEIMPEGAKTKMNRGMMEPGSANKH